MPTATSRTPFAASLPPRFPDDTFLGEETAAHVRRDRSNAAGSSIPIDGTHNFLRGVPYWNVSIGLCRRWGHAGRRRLRSARRCALPRAPRRRRVLPGGGPRRDGAARGCDRAARGQLRRARPSRPLVRAALLRHPPADDGRAALRCATSAPPRCSSRTSRAEGSTASSSCSSPAWDAVAGLLLVEEAGGWHAPFAPPTPTAKAVCVACAPGTLRDSGSSSPPDRLARGELKHGATSCRNRRRTRTRSRPASRYLRSAALTSVRRQLRDRRVHARRGRERAAEESLVDQRARDAASSVRPRMRSCITPSLAAFTSASVKPSFSARSNSSANAGAHLRQILGREDRVRADVLLGSIAFGWKNVPAP